MYNLLCHNLWQCQLCERLTKCPETLFLGCVTLMHLLHSNIDVLCAHCEQRSFDQSLLDNATCLSFLDLAACCCHLVMTCTLYQLQLQQMERSNNAVNSLVSSQLLSLTSASCVLCTSIKATNSLSVASLFNEKGSFRTSALHFLPSSWWIGSLMLTWSCQVAEKWSEGVDVDCIPAFNLDISSFCTDQRSKQMGILCNLMSTYGENLICATLNEMYRNPYFHISSFKKNILPIQLCSQDNFKHIPHLHQNTNWYHIDLAGRQILKLVSSFVAALLLFVCVSRE